LVLYADDSNLLIKSKSSDQLRILCQNTLNSMQNYYQSNKLGVNTTKTIGIHFSVGTAHNPYTLDLICDSNKITFNTSTRFLGLVIDSHLKWHEHTQYLRNKLSSICISQRVYVHWLARKPSFPTPIFQPRSLHPFFVVLILVTRCFVGKLKLGSHCLFGFLSAWLIL